MGNKSAVSLLMIGSIAAISIAVHVAPADEDSQICGEMLCNSTAAWHRLCVLELASMEGLPMASTHKPKW